MEYWLEELHPALNAGLNAVATVLLTAGFLFILRKRKEAHQRCMMSAFVISAVFLVSYVAHKALRPAYGLTANREFGGEGVWAAVYYFILITHVILAMVIVPLVLRTIYLAVRSRFEIHRKWARITFPIWYYVSITRVLVYFFLYQWFPKA
ncbi:MAG: DUF420 domain-containing protein [Opitutales bacterium]